jgi:hypothetical protein
MLQNNDEKSFIHNHLAFLVKYHKDETTDLSRIVGFEVKPFRLVLVMLALFCWYDAFHADTILFTNLYFFC